ncbi:dienelactone hydrolase family protein [Lysobacter hankyongensis]|uniref:Dienelactone hydrolase family protein n=1 Tax=Lysobacter hankyongensis TaxID=1176535 RepID=A0ABP9AH83_9GAMM
MGEWLPLTTPEGPVQAWLARPVTAPLGAVVVIQEIFGVNPHIRAVTDRFAEAGFTAMAPALFDPIRPGTELRYDDAGVSRGRDYAADLGFERALKIVSAAARWLRESGHRVGAVGFCWGGTLAMLANTRLHLPSVTYYGGRSVPFLGEPALAPMLFHFGERDRLIPPEDVEKHRIHHPDATVHVYPAGHGFNCDERADFDADSATLAWSRTTAFLTEHLR